MYEDGLYISHGPENRALAVIREDGGETLWIRNFATTESALNIMMDDNIILAESDRSEIEQQLARQKGYFSATPKRPKDGYKEIDFWRYTRERGK
jgi:hypothetical protein